MSDRASALGDAFRPGRHGAPDGEPGVRLSETVFDFVGEAAAFGGAEEKLDALFASARGKAATSLSFQFARNRWLLAGATDFRDQLNRSLKSEDVSLIDLTHGRAALSVSGPKAEWVLSKLFAVDFREAAFPALSGIATMHHDTFAQIYRSDAQSFDIFVYRSFARAFWDTLCRAAAEVGYEAA